MLESLSEAFKDPVAFSGFLIFIMKYLTDHTPIGKFSSDLKALTVLVLGMVLSLVGNLVGLLPGTTLEALTFGLVGGVIAGGAYSLLLQPLAKWLSGKRS